MDGSFRLDNYGMSSWKNYDQLLNELFCWGERWKGGRGCCITAKNALNPYENGKKTTTTFLHFFAYSIHFIHTTSLALSNLALWCCCWIIKWCGTVAVDKLIHCMTWKFDKFPQYLNCNMFKNSELRSMGQELTEILYINSSYTNQI